MPALLAALSLAAAAATYAADPSLPPPAGHDDAAPAASRDSASYSVGLSFATQWREGGLDGMLSEEDMIRGIRAGLAGAALTQDDRERASAFMRDAYQAWATHNKAAATEFLTHNAALPGVKTTASGLQYLIVTPGDSHAPAPRVADQVMVQYRGRLLNGTEFDSTYSRGKPGVIRPGDAMAGWQEALGMMTKGAVWRVFVPPDLAYAMTPPPSIPPNSLLIFDIELLGVNQVADARIPKPAAAAP
jgi:FKBP-type peptidyl-prolyl cis-trans isomerase FklB